MQPTFPIAILGRKFVNFLRCEEEVINCDMRCV